MEVVVRRADLSQPADQAAMVELLDLYARDPMGGGTPLPESVRQNLAPRLAELPHARVWLAWREAEAVGLAVAFLAFSTFKAQPLMNLHDVTVRDGYRGQGIGRQLLAAAEAEARQLGCCKLTLEVRTDNPARRLYERFGFAAGEPGQYFLTKPLDGSRH